MKEKGNQKHMTDGSITVYLSLILLLILSLVFTIIEGARINTSKVFAERALSTAMDSLLAEYYGPLWEEYHLFAYDTGTGSAVQRSKEMENKLAEYMSYTLEPEKELEKRSDALSVDLFGITTDAIAVPEQTMLMDYNAQLVINEAVEYTKYLEIGNGLESLLDKFSLLETPNKVSIIYEKKQKAEEELAEIDIEILKLMELLDGIRTGKRGVETDHNGQLQIEDYFIKKICFEEISEEAVGINHEAVFRALKTEYYNPTNSFTIIKNNFSTLGDYLSQAEQLESLQDLIQNELMSEKEKLEQLKDIDDPSSDILEQMKSIKEQIKDLETENEGLSSEITALRNSMDHLIAAIQTSSSEVSIVVNNAMDLTYEAMWSIERILEKAKKAEPLIKQYEEILLREKDNLNLDILDTLAKDLEDLKRYTSQVEGAYNFPTILEILERNWMTLSNTRYNLESGNGWLIRETLNQKNYQYAVESFETAYRYITSYQIRGLALDYSTLVLEKDVKVDPLLEVNNLIGTGITSLLLDPTLISDAELTEVTLPSAIAALSNKGLNSLSSLTNFFGHAAYGDKNTVIRSLFGDFSSETDLLSKLGEGVNAITEHLLYQEYIMEHFMAFPMKGEDISSRKPSVLLYEQEYLLTGKTSDQENINSVLQRILFFRTICDFVSILGDKDKVNEAKAVAATLVGFTGLPILVSITQTVILLLWSFSEALLDVCAFLMGKEVPIIKKQVVMQFTDLFLISRTYLQSKASKLVDTKELSFGYKDYIRLFMVMKRKEELAYRSLDLIQENLSIQYDTRDYSIANSLFGLKAVATLRVKPKLTGLSFVQELLGNSEDFCYTVYASHSY